MQDDRPPLGDNMRLTAMHDTIKQIRDGFDQIAMDLVTHPVICVIRWVQKSPRIDNGFVYEIYDLGEGNHPIWSGSDTNLDNILGVAEDYRALVILYNQKLARYIQLNSIPAILLSDEDRQELREANK